MAQAISKMETTAVEWFFDNLNNHEIQAEHFELYKHAIAMEKEQIEKAKSDGYHEAMSEAIKEIHKNYKPI